MKKQHIFGLAVTLFLATAVFGQDIPQNQVPSVVVNSFQKAFSKAKQVEWELEGDRYKVEFEVGMLGLDHDAWYDKTGQLLKHKEEISKNDLPKKVSAKLKQEFNGYRIEDVEKITEGNKVTYTLEAKSRTQEWKLAFDAEGNVLNKVAD